MKGIYKVSSASGYFYVIFFEDPACSTFNVATDKVLDLASDEVGAWITLPKLGARTLSDALRNLLHWMLPEPSSNIGSDPEKYKLAYCDATVPKCPYCGSTSQVLLDPEVSHLGMRVHFNCGSCFQFVHKSEANYPLMCVHNGCRKNHIQKPQLILHPSLRVYFRNNPRREDSLDLLCCSESSLASVLYDPVKHELNPTPPDPEDAKMLLEQAKEIWLSLP